MEDGNIINKNMLMLVVGIQNEDENENVMNDNNKQLILSLDSQSPINWDNLDNNLRNIFLVKQAIEKSNFLYLKILPLDIFLTLLILEN